MRTVPLAIASLFTLLLAPATPSGAAPVPEWGEFTREELFATHFPEAPEADAVVLFDFQEIKIDPELHLRLRRHTRTRIFTPAGAARAEMRIPCAEGDKVQELRAQTVVPPARFVKVEGEDITRERTDDGEVLVIRFPEVAPGVIVECSYEYWSKRIDRLEPWSFQNDVWTRRSRLDLLVPEGLTYDAVFGWVPGTEPKPHRDRVIDPDHPRRELLRASWELGDLPPYRPEPMLPNPVDYRLTLYLQLLALEGSRQSAQIAPGWKELAEPLAEAWEQALADGNGLAKFAGRAEATGNPAERARALYRLVRDGIASDGPEALLAPAGVARVAAAGRGSDLSRALLLVRLLRDAGLEADGVLVRPVERGTFRPRWRALEQLEHALVRTVVDGGEVYLDAGGGPCPFGVLPPTLRVESGLLVSPGASRIVEVRSRPVESRAVAATAARLGANGDLAARSQWTLEGCEAIAARARIAAEGRDVYVRTILATHLGDVELESVEVVGLEDDEAPLRVEAAFRRAGWAQATPTRLECAVPFIFAPAESPLPEGERKYPMHFGVTATHDERVDLHLPEGWAARQTPEESRADTAELSYALSAESAGSSVRARRRFVVRETPVRETKAEEVRSFFQTVLAADEAPLLATRSGLRGLGPGGQGTRRSSASGTATASRKPSADR